MRASGGSLPASIKLTIVREPFGFVERIPEHNVVSYRCIMRSEIDEKFNGRGYLSRTKRGKTICTADAIELFPSSVNDFGRRRRLNDTEKKKKKTSCDTLVIVNVPLQSIHPRERDEPGGRRSKRNEEKNLNIK